MIDPIVILSFIFLLSLATLWFYDNIWKWRSTPRKVNLLPGGRLAEVILDALQEGEMSGYELAKAIDAKYPELLSIGAAKIYPVLHELQELGEIESNSLRIPERPGTRTMYRLKGQ